jgi:transcriptional regulator of heat shock response
LGDAADTVKVRIGSEQSEKNLKSTSLVTVGYGDVFGESGASLGALGILGPTRMDYAGSMAAVGAVARYVGRFISEGSYK